MAIKRNPNIAITLLFSLLILLALAPPSSANAVSPDVPHRRDHVNLNRMIKRRAPHALLPRQPASDPSGDKDPQAQAGAVGAAADPSTGALSSPVPSSTPAASAASATQASETSQSPQPTSAPVSSAASSATPSVSSTSSQSSVSSTSSTTPTSTTSSLTPSTSSSHSTSSTPTPSSQVNKQQLPASNGQSASVDSVTLTSHAPAASSSGSSDSSQIGGSSLSHSAIMILIIIAASIGGCVIVWTIIRKWKFRPSSQFEDRLEPVDWQPADHDSGLPTHRRVPSNASSFHSAGHDNIMGLSRSDSGGAYNAARNLTPIPDHDFTAGPAAAVGGYADLARGPSPQPPMQEALQRGPSINGAYENYQGGNVVPEAYDYNNAGPRY